VIKNVNKISKTVSASYSSIVSFVGSLYAIQPLVKMIVNTLILRKPFVPEMATKSEFFFDVSKSPAFEISFFMCTCRVYATIVFSVSQSMIDELNTLSSLPLLSLLADRHRSILF
jgi:hypothetical protein